MLKPSGAYCGWPGSHNSSCAWIKSEETFQPGTRLLPLSGRDFIHAIYKQQGSSTSQNPISPALRLAIGSQIIVDDEKLGRPGLQDTLSRHLAHSEHEGYSVV
jgi:hypothetical protein